MKTILAIVLLALTFSVSAQPAITGQKTIRDASGKVVGVATTYSDGTVVETQDRDAPYHPDYTPTKMLEREEAQLEATRDRQNSLAYLKEKCEAEGNRVFWARLNYGRYWNYYVQNTDYSICQHYRAEKKKRKKLGMTE